MRSRALVAALGLLVLSACAAGPPTRPLVSARITPDFDTYPIRRVGLMPMVDRVRDTYLATTLQEALQVEFSRASSYEVVRLEQLDLAEVPGSQPYLRGWYKPETILNLSKRYSLDAILVGTVMGMRPYPPQQLSVEVDLVSAETGLVIWHAYIHLDASDALVREHLEWYFNQKVAAAGSKESVSLTMISPTRFGRFAAHHLASALPSTPLRAAARPAASWKPEPLHRSAQPRVERRSPFAIGSPPGQ